MKIVLLVNLFLCGICYGEGRQWTVIADTMTHKSTATLVGIFRVGTDTNTINTSIDWDGYISTKSSFTIGGYMELADKTSTQLSIITPTKTGWLYWNSTTGRLSIATGTVRGSFAAVLVSTETP